MFVQVTLPQMVGHLFLSLAGINLASSRNQPVATLTGVSRYLRYLRSRFYQSYSPSKFPGPSGDLKRVLQSYSLSLDPLDTLYKVFRENFI